MDDQYLRLREVALLLGVCPNTVRNKFTPGPYYDKSFPHPIRVGARAIAFSSRELRRWLEGRANLMHGGRQ